MRLAGKVAVVTGDGSASMTSFPMKVEQQPEDIGNAAVFLASDGAR